MVVNDGCSICLEVNLIHLLQRGFLQCVNLSSRAELHSMSFGFGVRVINSSNCLSLYSRGLATHCSHWMG